MSKTSIKNRFFCLLLALSVAICTIPSITVSAYNSFDGGYDSIYIYQQQLQLMVIPMVLVAVRELLCLASLEIKH